MQTVKRQAGEQPPSAQIAPAGTKPAGVPAKPVNGQAAIKPVNGQAKPVDGATQEQVDDEEARRLAAGEGEGDDGSEGDDGGEDEGEETGPVMGHGGQMPPEAIRERVARERRKLMKQLFGQDIPPEEAKRLLDEQRAAAEAQPKFSDDQVAEYERLKRAEEARKRSRMTAEQRAKVERETYEQRIQELETRLKEKETQEAVRTQEEIIATAAAAHIDPKYLRFAKGDLAAHLRELQTSDPETFAQFGEEQIGQWMQAYATDNPIFAATQEAAAVQTDPKPAAGTQAPPVRRKVTTNASTTARPEGQQVSSQEPPGTYKGKTVFPGRPNSMTEKELKEYYLMKGMKFR